MPKTLNLSCRMTFNLIASKIIIIIIIQERVKVNGTHQILFYADYVHVMAESIRSIKT